MIGLVTPLIPLSIVFLLTKLVIAHDDLVCYAPLFFSLLSFVSLFYRCDKTCKIDLSIKARLKELSKQVGIPCPSSYTYKNNSINAYVNGIGKYTTIYASKGLSEYGTKEQVDSVLLHELYHVFHKHILLRAIAMHLAGIQFSGFLLLRCTWLDAFHICVYNMVAFGILTILFEMQADRSTASIIGPEGLVGVLGEKKNTFITRLRIWSLQNGRA
jgi:Zn-dependent protease with chaperone function